MQAVRGDRVGQREFPSRKDRLHELEAMRHPIDASEQGALVHAGRRRGRQPEDDLRLDPRLGQTRERNGRPHVVEIVDRPVVDVSPHGRADLVFVPDRAVGEADLASQRCLATRFTHLPHGRGDAIRVVEIEARQDVRRTARSGDRYREGRTLPRPLSERRSSPLHCRRSSPHPLSPASQQPRRHHLVCSGVAPA